MQIAIYPNGEFALYKMAKLAGQGRLSAWYYPNGALKSIDRTNSIGRSCKAGKKLKQYAVVLGQRYSAYAKKVGPKPTHEIGTYF